MMTMNANNGDFFFKTDGGDGLSVLTLKDNGNVGIGIESPVTKLQVEGDISGSGTGSFEGGGIFSERVGIGTSTPLSLFTCR